MKNIWTAEEFEQRLESLKNYFKRNPIWASVYLLVLVCCLVVGPLWGLLQHSKASDIEGEMANLKLTYSETVQELKRENSTLRTRYDNLENVVAPIIRQAAAEFPGEEISDSLKKLVQRFAEQPSFSIFLNNVRLQHIGAIQIPRHKSTKLNFRLENVGTAESRDPQIGLLFPSKGTNSISGSWKLTDTFYAQEAGILPVPEGVALIETARGRVSVGSFMSFSELSVRPETNLVALGMKLDLDGDGVRKLALPMWILVGDEQQTNAIVMTGMDATNALDRISPDLLSSVDYEIKSIWKAN